jgi:prepilin signal peptidase PulO-like enzyme (type II secretory pathway)
MIIPPLFFAGLTFILGLILGSFLNVLIPRLHFEEKGIISGRSHCPKCEHELQWFDLIPLLSFASTGGKCRYCKTKVSWWYPSVEFTTGFMFMLLSLHHPDPITWVSQAFFFYILLFIFFMDLRYSEIHDLILIPAIAIALIGSFLNPEPLNLLIGGGIGFSFFAFQYLISKGVWVGAGDMRIGAFMGLLLGWKHTLIALFIAYLIGSTIGIILLSTKKANAQTAIPLGPFLVIGTTIAYFFGSPILTWFLNLSF